MARSAITDWVVLDRLSVAETVWLDTDILGCLRSIEVFVLQNMPSLHFLLLLSMIHVHLPLFGHQGTQNPVSRLRRLGQAS